MESDILNAALDMRLRNVTSVNERLQALYPRLDEEEAERYRRECGLALSYGVKVAEKIHLKDLPPGRTGDDLLLERFPWLQSEKVSWLLSYGLHSAAHNFGLFPGFRWGKAIAWSLCFFVFVFALFLLAWWA